MNAHTVFDAVLVLVVLLDLGLLAVSRLATGVRFFAMQSLLLACMPLAIESLGGEVPGRAMGPRAAVEEALVTLGVEPAQPLVCGGQADAGGIRRLGRRPVLVDDAMDQQLASEHVETRPILGHGSHPRVWSFDTPDPERWLSVVNDVCGNYI